MIEKSDILKFRIPEHDISPIFPQRWSSRALSEGSIGEEELMSLFEAARWAPSSYNNQPWRFLYARRETSAWDRFYGLLSDYNKKWTRNAAVLIVIVSKKTFDYSGKPSRTHSYDTGAAWMSLALQGSINGLVVHGMQGFDYDRAKEELRIPDDYTVEAMAAVGRPGRKEDLPEDIRKGETPNSRKKVEEFAFEGGFPE